MENNDKALLDTYMWGFNDGLDGRKTAWIHNPILKRAYNLGRMDAEAGDDVSSSDSQTNQQILNRIREVDEKS